MKVIAKIVLLCMLLDISFAAHLKDQLNESSTKLQQRDGRHPVHADRDYALESSVFGILIITIAKTVWSILSTVWSIAAYKLSALAVATKSAVWLVTNGFTVVVGAVLMYGFCILTDKCSLDTLSYAPEGLIPVIPQEVLDSAQLSLQKGAETYEEKEKVDENEDEDAKDDLITS